jgi:hypothetical protein
MLGGFDIDEITIVQRHAKAKRCALLHRPAAPSIKGGPRPGRPRHLCNRQPGARIGDSPAQR